MIDWDRLASLQADVGAEELDEVIALFFEEVDPILARLSHAQDADELAGDLHFLKSCAVNIGFAAFARLCHQGEKTAKQAQIGAIKIPETLDAFETSKQQLLSGLPQFKAAHPM